MRVLLQRTPFMVKKKKERKNDSSKLIKQVKHIYQLLSITRLLQTRFLDRSINQLGISLNLFYLRLGSNRVPNSLLTNTYKCNSPVCKISEEKLKTLRRSFRLIFLEYSYFRYSFRRRNPRRLFIHPVACEIKFFLILILFAYSISIESKIFDRQTRWNQETLKSQSFRWIDVGCVYEGKAIWEPSLPRQREFVIENRNSVLDSVDRVSRDAKPPNNPPSPPFRSCILRVKRSSIVAKLFGRTIFYDTSSLLKGCYISGSPFQSCCSSFLKFKMSYHKWMQRSMDQYEIFIIYMFRINYFQLIWNLVLNFTLIVHLEIFLTIVLISFIFVDEGLISKVKNF